MERFLSIIDISDNLARTLQAVRGIRGSAALFYLLFFVLPMLVVTSVLSWVFDVQATLIAGEGARNWIAERFLITSGWLDILPAFALAITLAPTLFEMGGALFARAGIVVAQWAVYALCLFDIVTDAPVTSEFLMTYAPAFDALPAGLSTVAYWSVFTLWLGLASYGFELLTVCLFVASIVLILNAGAGRRVASRG